MNDETFRLNDEIANTNDEIARVNDEIISTSQDSFPQQLCHCLRAVADTEFF